MTEQYSYIVAKTFRHRGQARPNQHWDALEDEVELEQFDLSQPHSQPPRRQRPLAALGTQAQQAGGVRGGRGVRGRGGRGRGGRGGRGGGSQPAERATVVQQLDRRALSILKKGKQPAPRRQTLSQPVEVPAIDFDNPVPGPSSQSRKRRHADFISESDSD